MFPICYDTLKDHLILLYTLAFLNYALYFTKTAYLHKYATPNVVMGT